MRALLTAVALSALSLLISGPAHADSTADCHVGSYRLTNGRTVDIAPSDGDALRWRTFAGDTGLLHRNSDGSWSSMRGWTRKPDGIVVSFSDCKDGAITFGGATGKRIAFDVTDTTFESNGVKMSGRLVMPKGNGHVPLVILLHGSEHDSARKFNALQRMFPAQGIAAFVYDKRGTGASGGVYTQDFDLLAADAVQAMMAARRLAGTRVNRVGFQGPSEGGWVAPLAANRSKVDFVIVSFGLAVSVLQEDQESVALDMSLHRRSPEDTAKALELARAGERVIETRGSEGYAEFDALRKKYKGEPWYRDVHGDFVYFVLPLNEAQVRVAARQFDFHTPFRYDPMPALRASQTPQLWALGSDDLDAPSGETANRIKTLIAAGKDYTLAVFPGAEHGMTEYELGADGERISTRYVPGYFELMRDFIRDGHVAGNYGEAAIAQPHGP